MSFDSINRWVYGDDQPQPVNRGYGDATTGANRTAKPASVERFERALRAAEGIYYRIDKGVLTGRNSDATSRSLRARVNECRDLLSAACKVESDPLPEWLDAHPRLAERWAKIERRYFGLPGHEHTWSDWEFPGPLFLGTERRYCSCGSFQSRRIEEEA